MLKRLLLSGAALAALTTYAAAQAAPPADQSSPPAASSPASPGMANPDAQAQQADPNLFSNIKGADVLGENNDSIGSVADLLLDQNGELKSMVIAHGGLAGIGQTYRNYEVSELPQVADGKVTLGQINTAALEGMPEYAYPEAETGRAATDTAPSGNAAPAGGASGDAAAPSAGADLWPASYIVGAKVGEGDDAGSVSDLRFEGNKVSKVLIDQGSLGLGNKVQEIAWEDLEISGTPAEPKLAMKSGSGASTAPDAGGSPASPPAAAPPADTPPAGSPPAGSPPASSPAQ